MESIILKKKNHCLELRALTEAVCENMFSSIENRVLRFSFIYKTVIWNIFTSIIKIQKKSAITLKKLELPAKDRDMLQADSEW